ncbi:MAG TPA: phosphotransferase family protein, partial [Burkholderiaceae bacterium]|nr:phosphotransferase family protein [Burkholderiaceae bacterium]
LAALQRWAVPSQGERIESLQRLSGGASQQTWAFDLCSDAGSVPLVLRRAPPAAAQRARLGVGLAAEAQLIAAACAAGVPVPRIHRMLSADAGLGEGFVMERLAGETLGRRIVRDPRFAAARRVLARQCGEALARIHAIPTPGLPPLRRGGAAAEQLFQLDLHRRHGTVRPVFALAFQWLRRHAPREVAQPVLVHGDFRNGNLMVGDGGLVGVLDWELAHLGDPMEDLGWLCVNAWRFGNGDWPVGGFGTREDLFAGYEAAGGRVDAARVHWWEVLGTLKWGIVCEAMAHAWLSGEERDLEKAAIGRRASESEIDLLALLAPDGAPHARPAHG